MNTLDVGLAGIEVYDILRDYYDIQTEFGDLGNLLAYVSVGDRERDLERLVAALADIRRRYKRDKATLMRQEYISPQVVAEPQEAFYADKQSVALDSSSRPHLRGVRHVLSARHPDPRARRAHHARTFSIISATPRKRTACCSAPRTPR